MKRVLFDHCVPRPFRSLLVNCSIATALELGWEQLKNGELIDHAEANGFDVLITADKNLRYQQNLASRGIAIIELPTNRLREIATYAPKVNSILTAILPGEYHIIPY
jgi:hypothetical protein